MVPGTKEVVRCYPTKMGEKELPIVGPVKNFTVLLDLEKGCVVQFGQAASGFYKEIIGGKTARPRKERLALGCHKKLYWEEVKKRQDIKELLPVWFHLSSWYTFGYTLPSDSLASEVDTFGFLPLFLSGFKDLFVPLAEDVAYLGYALPPLGKGVDPFTLFPLSFDLIRGLFFLSSKETFRILPRLLFPFGKMTGIEEDGVSIDLEWSKGMIRRLFVTVSRPTCKLWEFQKEVKKFRWTCLQTREKKQVKNKELLTLEAGRHLFDRFEK